MSVHRQFDISRPTIDRWLALRAECGHVRPKVPVRCGPAPAIGDLGAFESFARRNSTATLEQMVRAWQQEHGVKLSRNTFSLALRRIGASAHRRIAASAGRVKKRASYLPSATPPNARSLPSS